MKRVLMATVAAIGLIATSANAFQANNPPPRQQTPAPQYNQQLEKKPNERVLNVDGWTVLSWNDEFSDKLSISVSKFGPKGAVAFRCWAGVELNLLLSAAPLKSGEEYQVEFRFDQNPPFVSIANAIGDSMLQIISGGDEHAVERFLIEFASARMIRYRTSINGMDNIYKVELGGHGTNVIAQVLRACKDMPTETSQNKRGGKDA
jgi:hypothetical protein